MKETRRLPTKMEIHASHDADTGSVSYLVVDARSGRCAAVDCVLGFDPRTGRTEERNVAHWIALIERRKLTLEWILETHVHADHLSGAFALRAAAGGRIGIGAGVLEVATRWRATVGPAASTNVGASFDRLFLDGDPFTIGTLQAGVIATPGHTPSCVTYLVADAAFVGDALFMPQAGTARCDFPGGSARMLYRSTRRILALPSSVRVFCAHDYGHEQGRPAQWESTIAQQRRDNVQAGLAIGEDEFVALRERRDRTLAPPALLHQALRFNLSGGRLAPAATAA
jgi:glyoxylase-like metal-dependent hydrolase (beta-lactamase superfamily II)